jgi:hypothetical protein
MRGLSAWISLFASTSTLVCCALPSLLVALGMGATMAGLVSTIPQLIWLSQYKVAVFVGSAVMLSFSALLQYRARFEPCPIDHEQAKACSTGRLWSQRILILSVVIWAVGAFFAFVAPLF